MLATDIHNGVEAEVLTWKIGTHSGDIWNGVRNVKIYEVQR